jgi:nitrate/nitrite transport system permease protein
MPLFSSNANQLAPHFSYQKISSMFSTLFFPSIGIVFFILFWQFTAPRIQTSLGTFPTAQEVYHQLQQLVVEHQAENKREYLFDQRELQRQEKLRAENPEASIQKRQFTRRPTLFNKIGTSLITVLCGFIVATSIAVPIGILVGLSQRFYQTLNPLVQIFKPVSPLAWLPLVTLVVSAAYQQEMSWFPKSFVISVCTVTLCSLWPTLINTAVGVASVPQELKNVSRVFRFSRMTHLSKIVLPCALPMMFTGLRISLGIAWMVLIAAEMLAQNPGLGKFIWDEFQNGSSESLSRICVAVLIIGGIGFFLDRIMIQLQKWISWDKNHVTR